MLLQCVCKKFPALLALAIFMTSCTTPPPTEVLILPEDRPGKQQHMYAGTREYFGLAGLSRLEVPDRDGNLYVIDRQAAARSHVDSILSQMPRDAYISIYQNQGLISRYVHVVQTQDGTRHVQYRYFQGGLLGQVAALFRETEQPEGNGSVEFMEYRFAMDECAGLSTEIQALENGLRDAVNRIGLEPRSAPGTIEEVVVDGPAYRVVVRMEKMTGRFPVGGNSGPIFDVVRDVLRGLQNCVEGRSGTRREIPLYGGGSAVEIIHSER